MASEPPAGRARRAAAVLLKLAGVLLAVIAVIGAAGTAFVSSRYFTAAVEAELVKSMQDAKHRTLRFDGPLEIFFWPNAGFKVGRMSLSEAGSAQEFASLDAARFSVAVAPLWQGLIVIDGCDVQGLKAAIVKRRDGTLNIDDLFASEQPSNAEFKIDVAGIRIARSALTWADEGSGKSTTVSDLDLASARLQADTAAKTLQADAVSLAGRVGDAQLRLAVNGLAAAPAALAAERIALDFDYKTADAALSGSLNARLAVDPQGRTIALEHLAGDIDIAHPRLVKRLTLPLRGGLQAGRDAARGDLETSFDDSKATLKFAVPRYSPPALRFDIDVDRLDVGRYLAPHHAEAAPAKTQGSAADLSALDGIELDGVARIGSLRMAGVTSSNIKLEIHGTPARLDVRGSGAKGG